MKKLFTLVFLVLVSFAHAQTYKSIVCDSLTREPLPSASIRVKGTNIGTTTNTDGKFNLTTKKGILIISYIGYLSKSIPTNALPDTILLAENNLLNEIVIMPDSALRVLLKNAYKNISKNYAQKPTFLTGFYREINESVDSSRFNYFSESVLKAYKPPYTVAGSGHQGQVKVLKTRKVIHPSYERNGAKFYGGPYLMIRGDDVLRRSNFINPKDYRKFSYELEKITSYEGKPVYVVAFENRDSVYNGKIYIDKTDLAFIKIETYRKLDKKEKGITRLDVAETLIYDKKDSLWYLKYYKVLGKFKSSKEHFNLSAEYVTTNISDDSVKTFTYDEEFNYLDIIARTDSKISDDFFQEYSSVLSQTESLKKQIDIAFPTNVIDSLRAKEPSTPEQINKAPVLQISKSERMLYKILNMLQYNLTLTYFPVESLGSNFAVGVNDVFSSPLKYSKTTKMVDVPLVFGVNFGVKFNKRWALVYQIGDSFGRQENVNLNKADVGISYRFLINRGRKPIFVEPNIKYSNLRYGIQFGTIDNPQRNILIDGEKFNSKKLASGIYQRTEGIKLGVSTNIYSRKSMKILLNLDYMMPISTQKPYFELKEKGFWQFSPKKVRFDLNDSRLTILPQTELALPKLSNNFWVGLSLRLGL
ncbi:MAG: carboxypeptidase-like regulatory domain-containing protein [Emticicia sp.]|nr:carboxypeptidase-like regulatory domain-containing protein [Emticicia sp.]